MENEREKLKKILSKRTFGGDFRADFPDFSEISPLLGGLGRGGRQLGGHEKSTWSHPTTCACRINKWHFQATSRQTSIDSTSPARDGCKNS